ncbi:MAG: hypothetical protein IJD33_02180, partial [Clostridia bacterium]|nr:hypothetical protein [Clostridia bacterium]
GKTGVEFEVAYEADTQTATMSSSGYNIYFDSGHETGLTLSQGARGLKITDIVTEKIDTRDGVEVSIADKLDTVYANNTLKGADGEYYALPHFALYGGLTYDQNLFDREGYYFAAPESEQTEATMRYECDFGTAYFVGSASEGYGQGKKSCGNDGEYGTSDDGMPTSLIELLILCDRMAYNSDSPFTLPGEHDDYGTYLEAALFAALAGPNETYTRFTGEGQMLLVTGYTDENLFPGVDYIKKPTTNLVTINESNRNLINDSVYRYYAIAFQEVAYHEGWYSLYCRQPECSHIDAMKHFMYSGKNGRADLGMLIEGDYWYNEATDNNVPQEYKNVTQDSDRRVAWMALPTSLDVTVTEGNGRQYCMYNQSAATAFINANIDKPGNDGLVKACKDFLQFCYTDEELSYFTGLTGVSRCGISYELIESHLSNLSFFGKSVQTLKNSSNTVAIDVQPVAWGNGNLYRPYIGRNYGSTYQAFRLNTSATTKKIFDSRRG